MRKALSVFVLFGALGVVSAAGDAAKGLQGTFTRKLGEDVWSIDLDGKGKFKVFMGKEQVVEGKYKVTKDEVEITDESGKLAYTDKDKDKTGTYKWVLKGDALHFTKVKDAAEGRSKALESGPWQRKK